MSQIVTRQDDEVVFGGMIKMRVVGDGASQRPPARRFLAAVRRRWPRVLLAAVLGVLLLLAIDSLGGGLMYRARQGQLAADFRTPRNYTAQGRALAVLQIPKLGLNVVTVEGIGPPQLRAGPGHLPSSVVPGAAGNAVVFGHARRFGGPFGSIAKLAAGDEVYVQPKGSADVVKYRVTAVTTGGDELVDKLAPTDDVRLTIVTSAGGWFGSKHVVVEATADAPARKPPAATAAVRAPASLEPSGDVVNLSIVFALAWLALGVLVVRGLPSTYPSRVRWLVAVSPLALGGILLLLEIDRWLAATL